MSNKLAQFLIKQAGPYLRMNSDKNPAKPVPTLKNKAVDTVISMENQVLRPGIQRNNTIVKPGSNSSHPDKGYLYPLLHPWNNTISGTGFGNRYWAEPQNPFAL
jgi:hypothetical protein